MSATDDLRRLLDERGVEWANPNSICADITTTWRDGGWEYEAVESSYGDELSLQAEYAEWATPAQAAEMTLERGKCKTVSMDCFGNPPFNTSGLNGNSTAAGCSE